MKNLKKSFAIFATIASYSMVSLYGAVNAPNLTYPAAAAKTITPNSPNTTNLGTDTYSRPPMTPPASTVISGNSMVPNPFKVVPLFNEQKVEIGTLYPDFLVGYTIDAQKNVTPFFSTINEKYLPTDRNTANLYTKVGHAKSGANGSLIPIHAIVIKEDVKNLIKDSYVKLMLTILPSLLVKMEANPSLNALINGYLLK